jgi:hypothetical protein
LRKRSSRWYELVTPRAPTLVVAAFIHEHGDEVALRYLDHDDVERYKAALGFQEHAAALNEDPLTDEEMSHLRESYEALCAKYGSEFANAYGWAASALPRSGWSFAEIEQAMNQEHVRPMYKMASNAIHPNAGGSFVDLGLMPDDEIILAGPSTAGLADPAFSTCGSLFDCTRHVLDESPDLDGAMAILVLELLLWRVADAFQSAHDEHEARAQRAEAPAASEPEGPDGTTVAP